MKKTILFTGGGTAGHVTPNIAIIDSLDKNEWRPVYIGSKSGIEKQLIEAIHVPYYSISTGKLRRYFSWQNFIDPFKITLGILKSIWLCFKLKPAVVFSKGGFVSLPVVVGAWMNRIPVILHESDLTPGLANKLCCRFAKTICLTFDDTQRHFKDKDKTLVTGTPIRPALLNGNKTAGLAFTQFDQSKPIILIMCGSTGSVKINQVVRSGLDELLKDYQIIHICGKGRIDESLKDKTDYRQYEYINDELGDVIACADLVVSRAGANSLYELLSLHKPNLLIPISLGASRGDQIANARHFEKLGLSDVLNEQEMTPESLKNRINKSFQAADKTKEALNEFSSKDSISIIKALIESVA